MADPISGGSRPIQSTGIAQTQKTRDSEKVKAGSDAPYVQAQQQQQAKHIDSNRQALQDMAAQMREMIQQAKAQVHGQGRHRLPHGFKRLGARFAHGLNKQQGLMSQFRPHPDHHGGLSAMPGLEQTLTHVMSRLKASHVLSGQAPAGKTPLEAPALRPRELSPEEMGLEAQKPVLAPAGDATPYAPRTLQEQVMRMTPDQIKTAMQSADTTADKQSYLKAQLKYNEDPTVKEYIQAQQGRAQLLSNDVPIDDPAFQDLSARIAELKEKRPEPPKPEDFGIDGQKPDPVLAGKVPPDFRPPSSPDASTPVEDMNMKRDQLLKEIAERQKPDDPALVDNAHNAPPPKSAASAVAPPPPELPRELQGPSDDPAVIELQRAIVSFQQEWGDFSVKSEDYKDKKGQYDEALKVLNTQIAQHYSSVSSKYRN